MHLPRPPKQHIRLAFDRAASTYDSAAELQRLVCDRLAMRLSELPQPARILDAGCGTGYGAKLLAKRWPLAQMIRADFAPAMLANSGPGLPVCADIEALPFANGSFDLLWSSLTVQWCELSHTITEVAHSLSTDGRLALSTLGPGTFAEIDRAFAEIDPHRHVLDFLPAAAIEQACHNAGLHQIQVESETLAIHYPDLKTLLRAIKAIGAQGVANRRPSLLGKTAWRCVEAHYEQYRSSAGLPATYEVIYCTAQR